MSTNLLNLRANKKCLGYAAVVELACTTDLKSVPREGMGVRIPPAAPNEHTCGGRYKVVTAGGR